MGPPRSTFTLPPFSCAPLLEIFFRSGRSSLLWQKSAQIDFGFLPGYAVQDTVKPRNPPKPRGAVAFAVSSRRYHHRTCVTKAERVRMEPLLIALFVLAMDKAWDEWRFRR